MYARKNWRKKVLFDYTLQITIFSYMITGAVSLGTWGPRPERNYQKGHVRGNGLRLGHGL